MTSTFDAMQYALGLLSDHIESDDDLAHALIEGLKEIVDSLHDYSHQTNDAPHRAVAGSAVRLWKILRRDCKVG